MLTLYSGKGSSEEAFHLSVLGSGLSLIPAGKMFMAETFHQLCGMLPTAKQWALPTVEIASLQPAAQHLWGQEKHQAKDDFLA